MDLRSLPDGLSPSGRCDERRKRVTAETGVDLSLLSSTDDRIGQADTINCEQMLGFVGLPVGYAGPLKTTFSSKETKDIHLPLATTEGALVASVNRGCKALLLAGGVTCESTLHGISRSLSWKVKGKASAFCDALREKTTEWTQIAQATSGHLKVLSFDIDEREGHAFLTINADTDEAMGMNMITIAAQAVGDWSKEHLPEATFITVAANVDSDKKPSLRTYERGRGTEVFASATIPAAVIRDTLKSDLQAMLAVAKAKLELGSEIAGALGSNLHAGNVLAALYLATGQDPAHVTEGALADTSVEAIDGALQLSVRLPAVIVGVRGGGTSLPAQKQCLDLLFASRTSLHPRVQIAESVGAAVLAGELSLLAAQASHSLASAHATLGRVKKG